MSGGRIYSLFSILCAISTASGYAPLRASFGHIRVITGSDLVHADLPLAACRADIVSSMGFNEVRRQRGGGGKYRLLSILCAISMASGYELLRNPFG